MKISLPLNVPTSKDKSFYLNLNQYRNAHFHILNNAKIKFKEAVTKDILSLPNLNVIELDYTVYPRTKRELDISNVCSIVDKFFCDALVELGKLTDDSYKYVTRISYGFGEIDKMNPRVEVLIKETQPMKIIFGKEEITAALSAYLAGVMNIPTGSPDIVLEADGNGGFTATMEMEMQVPQLDIAISKSLVGSASVESIKSAPTTVKAAESPAEKPSLLGTKPKTASRTIDAPKAAISTGDSREDPTQAQESPESQDSATTADSTADAPVTENGDEMKAGTVNGDTNSKPVDAPKSIFSFKK